MYRYLTTFNYYKMLIISLFIYVMVGGCYANLVIIPTDQIVLLSDSNTFNCCTNLSTQIMWKYFPYGHIVSKDGNIDTDSNPVYTGVNVVSNYKNSMSVNIEKIGNLTCYDLTVEARWEYAGIYICLDD